jgi:hypothetical protein
MASINLFAQHVQTSFAIISHKNITKYNGKHFLP